MKKHLIFCGLSILFACNSGEKKTEINPNSVNQNADNQLKDKEKIIDDYIKSFNEIQDNLNTIKLKEKSVTLHSQSVELQKSNKDQIISDIQYIYDLLNKNRQALISINKKFKEETSKVKEVSSKNSELEKFIINLTIQVTEQETEIASLKNKLNTLKTELDLLNISSTNVQAESDHKTVRLNKAYFAIGTLDGLKKEGLIIEKGGVIGIGKIPEPNPNISKNVFSVIDIYETTEVAIAANKVKLITLHPADSYKLEDTKLGIKKLVITNPQEFWSMSKYLIIQVSNDKPLPYTKHILESPESLMPPELL
jgi:hypothetical protein